MILEFLLKYHIYNDVFFPIKNTISFHKILKTKKLKKLNICLLIFYFII